MRNLSRHSPRGLQTGFTPPHRSTSAQKVGLTKRELEVLCAIVADHHQSEIETASHSGAKTAEGILAKIKRTIAVVAEPTIDAREKAILEGLEAISVSRKAIRYGNASSDYIKGVNEGMNRAERALMGLPRQAPVSTSSAVATVREIAERGIVAPPTQCPYGHQTDSNECCGGFCNMEETKHD